MDSARLADGRNFMPERFEKWTRAGAPRQVLQPVRIRAPKGRRRFGGRARPLRPTGQARVHVRVPAPEAVQSASIPWSDASRPDQVVLLGPYRRRQQEIPLHDAVGRLSVSSRRWSRGSLLDSVRRNSATSTARSPTGDSGQPRLSTVSCRHTHQFNVVGPLRTCRLPGNQSASSLPIPPFSTDTVLSGRHWGYLGKRSLTSARVHDFRQHGGPWTRHTVPP